MTLKPFAAKAFCTSSGDAERLQGAQERAGGARSDPSDDVGASAERGATISEAGAVQALRADLESLPGVADVELRHGRRLGRQWRNRVKSQVCDDPY